MWEEIQNRTAQALRKHAAVTTTGERCSPSDSATPMPSSSSTENQPTPPNSPGGGQAPISPAPRYGYGDMPM